MKLLTSFNYDHGCKRSTNIIFSTNQPHTHHHIIKMRSTQNILILLIIGITIDTVSLKKLDNDNVYYCISRNFLLHFLHEFKFILFNDQYKLTMIIYVKSLIPLF